LLAVVDGLSGGVGVPVPDGTMLWPNPDVLASIVAMAAIMTVRMVFPGDGAPAPVLTSFAFRRGVIGIGRHRECGCVER